MSGTRSTFKNRDVCPPLATKVLLHSAHCCLKNDEVVFLQTDGRSVATVAVGEIAENAGSKNARQNFSGRGSYCFLIRIFNLKNCVVWI